MRSLLAESTDVSWLTPDLAVLGVSIGAFIVVGLWSMARHGSAIRGHRAGGDPFLARNPFNAGDPFLARDPFRGLDAED
jgi:hypothetical protein